MRELIEALNFFPNKPFRRLATIGLSIFAAILTTCTGLPEGKNVPSHGVSTGPVSGTKSFVGSTPAQGIAAQMGTKIHPGSSKAKWRLSLFKNEDTGQPTIYKIEGSLFPTPGSGTWHIEQGRPGEPQATVYALEGLKLLKGDAGVLFFLANDGLPLVGNDEFSYSLNLSIPAVQTP